MKLPLCLLALLLLSAHCFPQCPGGYTQAQLNWDKLDYYFNNGTNVQPYGHSTGTYVTDAMEMSQKFAIGPNMVTISTNSNAVINPGTANGVSAENTSHTGELAGYQGADVQYNPSTNAQTITITFNTAVANLNFALYDVDATARIDFAAVNGATPQNITLGLQGTTNLTANSNGTATAYLTSNATDAANNVNTNTATVSVTGPLTQITLTVTAIGTNAVFWLSDINACVTGSFPIANNRTSNNQPFTGPAGNQPDYFIVTPDNNSAYMVDPVSGRAWVLFQDPANTFMNSFAYDPSNRILYYITEGSPVNVNNKTLKKYNFNTDAISTVIADLTTLNIPSMNSGLESAAAAFYDGKLYLGIEGGRFSSSTTRESIVYRISFDASLNPVSACQVFAVDSYAGSTGTHDWADFIIEDGVLYNYNSRSGTTMVAYEHFNMMTGASTQYLNPNSGTGNAYQSGLTWAGEQYSFSSLTVTRYFENGTVGTGVPIVLMSGGTWVSGAGDASENFKPKSDYGDAPASYDPNPISPAVHERFDSLRLGATWDREWLLTSSANATSDGTDEDGVSTVNVLDTGTFNYQVTISAYNNSGAVARVGAWLDYNANGVFDASEYVGTTINSSASQQSVTLTWWTINTPLLLGQSTFMRIRITPDSRGMGSANATGYYEEGEVEDYQVFISVVLPVKILEFDAIAINNEKVSVDWAVIDENDMVSYTIERSRDAVQWEDIGSASARNQPGNLYYQHWDLQPLQGTSYYRLRTLDNKGNVRYSNIQKVIINTFLIETSIYPNPVQEDCIVKITSPHSEHIIFRVYNEKGSLILLKHVRINSGENKIPIRTSDLPAGVFILNIQSRSESKTYKFIKI